MLWWTLRQLKSSNKQKRRQAAVELGESSDARAVEPLVAALGDEDWEVRNEAVRSLSKISSERATESLVFALKHESDSVRSGAVMVLKEIGWKPADNEQRVLIALMEGGVKYDHMVGMGEAAVGPLVAELKRKDPIHRSRAVDALGCIGETAHKPDPVGGEEADEKLIRSPKQQRKLSARKANIKARIEVYDRLAHALIESLSHALADESSRVRWRSAEALGKLGDARAVDHLAFALKDEDEIVRGAAVDALGKIGDARAAELLAAALKDTSSGVRSSAEYALQSLKPKTWEVDRRTVSAPTSKGITTIIEVCSRNDLLDNSLINSGIKELKQEGADGARALAELIGEMLSCRSAQIRVALWAASELKAVPELISALQEVASASSLTPQPMQCRFTPEIIGGGRVGWTDRTAQDVKEGAKNVLRELGSLPPEGTAKGEQGTAGDQGWSEGQRELVRLVKAFAARETHLQHVKEQIKTIEREAIPVLRDMLESDLNGPVGLAVVQSISDVEAEHGLPLIAMSINSDHDSIRNVSIGYLEDHPTPYAKEIAAGRMKSERREDFCSKLQSVLEP